MSNIVGLLAVLSSAVVGYSSAEYNGSLRLVNVVFRHGERTPADTYPNDPHLQFDFEPYGWGQLTNEGKMQQFQQGRFLRDRYHEFLAEPYSTDRVLVQSTDVDRTIMSAQLTLAGLFPPKGAEIWNKDLPWQPVPVHYQPLSQDSLLLVRVPCPRYHEELERIKGTVEVKQHLDYLSDLYIQLTNYSGMPIENPDDVQSLYNTLLAEVMRQGHYFYNTRNNQDVDDRYYNCRLSLNKDSFPLLEVRMFNALPESMEIPDCSNCWLTEKAFYSLSVYFEADKALFNLTLPEWTKNYFPEEMEAVTAYSFVLNVYNDELKKLKGGPLLKTILRDMKEKSKNPRSKRNVLLYAGHDSTIANLMMALKVWDEQIPVYNIMSLIELHQVNDIYGIKVYLRNSTQNEPYLLTVPGCTEFCPLDTVLELTKNVVPHNLEEECLSHDSTFVPPSPSGP